MWWALTLPFRIIGWVLSGILFLLPIPFLLLGLLAAGIGIGFLILFPLVPLVLLAWGTWWLARRLRRQPVPVRR